MGVLSMGGIEMRLISHLNRDSSKVNVDKAELNFARID
jgi:hypothetical protein